MRLALSSPEQCSATILWKCRTVLLLCSSSISHFSIDNVRRSRLVNACSCNAPNRIPQRRVPRGPVSVMLYRPATGICTDLKKGYQMSGATPKQATSVRVYFSYLLSIFKFNLKLERRDAVVIHRGGEHPWQNAMSISCTTKPIHQNPSNLKGSL